MSHTTLSPLYQSRFPDTAKTDPGCLASQACGCADETSHNIGIRVGEPRTEPKSTPVANLTRAFVFSRRLVLKLFLLGTVCVPVCAWVLTLGIYTSTHVSAYCEDDKANRNPKFDVSMEPLHQHIGIPLFWGDSEDILPYPLEIYVTVDDQVRGDAVVIDMLTVTFDNGGPLSIVDPEHPRGGPFAKFEPPKNNKDARRDLRLARIGIPGAIHKRGPFEIRITGYIYGNGKERFERRLRMRYKRQRSIQTGWQALAESSA